MASLSIEDLVDDTELVIVMTEEAHMPSFLLVCVSA